MKDMRVEVKLLTCLLLLRRTSRIHHISCNENISFDPSTPCTTASNQPNHKPVHWWLSFSSSDNEDISSLHSSSHTSTSLPLNSMGFAKSPTKSIYTICDDLEEEEEEDFQTVALDDDHWITDPVPDRYLCIHEHLLSMPIHRFYSSIIPGHIGSQWHFWFWRYNDHLQWWRHPCSTWCDWTLKPADYG